MTIDFIDIEEYTNYYYHIMFAVTLVTFVHTQTMSIQDRFLKSYMKFMGAFLLLFTLIYMGFRPVHGVFVDMTTYARSFRAYAAGREVNIEGKDVLFHLFTKFSATWLTIELYFFLCACFYVIPLYIVSKKFFKDYWFYGFLLFVGSFVFWSYGTNGIRNGMAGSLFLLGVAQDKRYLQIIWFIIAINLHRSLLLPVLGFAATHFHNRPHTYYGFWLACIPLSLILPGFWESTFGGLVTDDRATYFTDEVKEGRFSRTGFRWDFLFYSSFGVIAGWYYIFKLKLKDNFYVRLYNTYLVANAFWILVIRANFSNRFAYLSWFFMALIIAYPWAKYSFTNRQHQKFGWVMLAYIGFTYYMQFVYYAQ